MAAAERVLGSLKAILQDPVARRAYVGRLQWLLRGSGKLQAWSLEYRAGIGGPRALRPTQLASDSEAVVTCPPSCGIQAPLSHLYHDRKVYRLERTTVSTATGATLLQTEGSGRVFVRESISWPFESILSHGLEIPRPGAATPGPAGPTVVFPTSGNYYHWLIEDVPLVLRAQEASPGAAAIAYGPGITTRHRTVMETIGMPLTAAPLIIDLREQVLPGRADDSWFVHPADAAALFELGARLSDGPTSGHERIWISRRGASRSIAVEAELEGMLHGYGFDILTLEAMPWVEQIAAFRGARVIAGLHGAGLSNLVFTRPGATLIELTNGDHYNRCFEFICHVAGHEYRAVASDDPSVTASGLLTEILASLS